MKSTILIIAGSDPTGGAGLQADIKTMTVIGVYAAAVVTCITVQNSRGVKRVTPLDPDLVSEQIKAVIEDHHVTHIKVGMVGTSAIAEAINKTLEDFTGEIIVDPVLLSTTGQELFQSSDITALKSNLISKATIITPNLPELSLIIQPNIHDPEGALKAAGSLLDEFSNLHGVLVKGGHITGKKEVTDFLLYRSNEITKLVSSTRPFIKSQNTHGTGCTLASAYAAYHSLTGDDELAFYNSTNFIQHALETSSTIEIIKNTEGCGGLFHTPMDSE
jgi:hydroxymethylpyrimidine/phosphomethylpyrimidine kinase